MSQPQTTPVYLHELGLLCSLGTTVEEISAKLFGPIPQNGYLSISEQYSTERQLPLGVIPGEFPPTPIIEEDSRNNRILTAAVLPLLSKIERLKETFGSDRIGVVLGTSTSGISDGERALAFRSKHGQFPEDYHYCKQEVSAPSRYLAHYLGITGPTWTVSTACTSAGKALASASRLIQSDICDAVIAGGVDSLCHMTIEGFSSLSVTDNKICNPFSRNRSGINIGEGAGIFIVSREEGPVRLAGYGESSDAHHISAPHPEGLGAQAAMQQALNHAKMTAADIDYLNFHGTATQQNDKMEGIAAHTILGADIACSSTKPLTGHTLGAAGAVEAAFCWLSLQREDGKLPPHLWDDEADPDIPHLAGLGQTSLAAKMKTAMSNSFAFGGNNIALILAAE